MTLLLIAEDNDDIRMIFTRVFERAGFTVVAEPDGRAALQRARQNPPDVVLTDLDMPVMNGAELCQAVRRDDHLKDIPVVIISGNLRHADPRLRDAQACGVLLKPISNNDLVDAIRTIVDAGAHPHAASSSCRPTGA